MFEYDHLKYKVDSLKANWPDPTLEEMTEKAINILQRGPNGFLLIVEGNMIKLGGGSLVHW